MTIQQICRAERRRAQRVFDRHVVALADDHPDDADESSDEIAFGREFDPHDAGVDTEPIL